MRLFILILLTIIGFTAKAQNTWLQKDTFPGIGRFGACGFSIGNKGYICLGADTSSFLNDLWEYDPINDYWTQKANFPGSPRESAFSFTIGNLGYVGTGDDAIYYNEDFFEYNPLTNAWTQKANFGGGGRMQAVGFSIGNKGYAGTGIDYSCFQTNDFWEYDPITDSWIQKAYFPGAPKSCAVGFSIGNKGYLGLGSGLDTLTLFTSSTSDFWEFDPVMNSWLRKADFPGIPAFSPLCFSIYGKVFVGLGFNSSNIPGFPRELYEYNPINDTWGFRALLIPNYQQFIGTSFSIGTKGYSVFGSINNFDFTNDVQEYSPDSLPGCKAYYRLFPDSAPYTYLILNQAFSRYPLNYSWDWGDGTSSTGMSPTHNYANQGLYTICLSITDTSGCTDTYCDSSYLYRTPSNSTMISVKVVGSLTGMSGPSINVANVKAYPNPSNTGKFFFMDLSQSAPLTRARVFDISGKMIQEYKNFNGDDAIDLSSFPAGLYLFQYDRNDIPSGTIRLVKN